MVGVACAGPFAEPVHGLDPRKAVWHVVPPLVEVGVPHALELVFAACSVVAEGFDAGLPPGGYLGAPGADGGDDAGCRGDGAAYRAGPG